MEWIKMNFIETRRRSVLVWKAIPEELLIWKPNNEAFSFIEMIRHVLEAEHLFHKIIELRGNLGGYRSPWENLEFSTVTNELVFADNFRKDFFVMLKEFSPTDLKEIRIERAEVGQSKLLGDYLNRMVYHEAVHTGQLLGYLRELDLERPLIWD